MFYERNPEWCLLNASTLKALRVKQNTADMLQARIDDIMTDGSDRFTQASQIKRAYYSEYKAPAVDATLEKAQVALVSGQQEAIFAFTYAHLVASYDIRSAHLDVLNLVYRSQADAYLALLHENNKVYVGCSLLDTRILFDHEHADKVLAQVTEHFDATIALKAEHDKELEAFFIAHAEAKTALEAEQARTRNTLDAKFLIAGYAKARNALDVYYAENIKTLDRQHARAKEAVDASHAKALASLEA
jgi:hypothetical protein